MIFFLGKRSEALKNHICTSVRVFAVSCEKWPRTKSFGTRCPCDHSRMLQITNRRVSVQVLRGQTQRPLHPGRRTRSDPQRGLSSPFPRPLAQLRRSDCSRAGAWAARPAVSAALSNLCYASAEAQCGPRRSCLQLTRFLARSERKPREKVTNLGAVSKFAPAASAQRVDNNDSIGWKATTQHALRLKRCSSLNIQQHHCSGLYKTLYAGRRYLPNVIFISGTFNYDRVEKKTPPPPLITLQWSSCSL